MALLEATLAFSIALYVRFPSTESASVKRLMRRLTLQRSLEKPPFPVPTGTPIPKHRRHVAKVFNFSLPEAKELHHGPLRSSVSQLRKYKSCTTLTGGNIELR